MKYILNQRTCGTIQPPVTTTGGCCGGGCGTPAPSPAPAPIPTPPDAVIYEPPTGGGCTGPTYEPESD